MDDLGSLRAEVARLRRATTRKVSRLKQRSGAQVSGTEFDPRRKPHVEGRYTQRQLATYRDQLQGFLSRKNQFVGGASGVPIPRSEWDRYKTAEKAYNAKVNEHFQRVADIELPAPIPHTRGETLGSRMERMTPSHRHLRNEVVNSPYDPLERSPRSVVSRDKLAKLIESLEAKMAPDYDERQAEASRDQFRRMADEIGDAELKDRVDKLSDEQFDVLWNYTSFPWDLSLDYEVHRLLHEGKDRPFLREAAENARKGFERLITWAGKLKV